MGSMRVCTSPWIRGTVTGRAGMHPEKGMASWAVFPGKALHLSLNPSGVWTSGEDWKGGPPAVGGGGAMSRDRLGQVLVWWPVKRALDGRCEMGVTCPLTPVKATVLLRHTCVCVHTHTHAHVHTCTQRETRTHMNACTRTCTHAQRHTHIHAHTHMCPHAHRHTQRHTHTFTCTRACTHTYTRAHMHTHAHIHKSLACEVGCCTVTLRTGEDGVP